MPDLAIQGGALVAAAAGLRESKSLSAALKAEQHELEDDAREAGAACVSKAAAHFVAAWSYGLGCLDEDIDALAALLDRCVSAFADVEAQLTRGLGGGS